MPPDPTRGDAIHPVVAEVPPTVTAGQTVWCRTAGGEWWKTTAAGPVCRSIGNPSWLAVPVFEWYSASDRTSVNWPAGDVRTTDPALADEIDPPEDGP